MIFTSISLNNSFSYHAIALTDGGGVAEFGKQLVGSISREGLNCKFLDVRIIHNIRYVSILNSYSK